MKTNTFRMRMHAHICAMGTRVCALQRAHAGCACAGRGELGSMGPWLPGNLAGATTSKAQYADACRSGIMPNCGHEWHEGGSCAIPAAETMNRMAEGREMRICA